MIEQETSTQEEARQQVQRGRAPVPIPYMTKGPTLSGWQNLRLGTDDVDQYFNGHPQNLGLLTGAASGGLVDIDLDVLEAIALAPYFLPTTAMVHGRESKSASHYWYQVDPVGSTKRFQDPIPSGDGGAKPRHTTLVEYRADGCQTVIPPSVHASGEQLQWVREGEPTQLDGDVLMAAVQKLAAATLLARYWPAEGGRHDAALALGGGLLRGGWSQDDAEHFIGAVARIAGDDEADDRARCVATTADRLAADEAATGWNHLKDFFDQRVLDKVRKWLGLKGSYAIVLADVEDDLAGAREVLDGLVQGDEPKQALRDALETPATLDALALVAQQEPGVYEAAMLKLHEAGVPQKQIDGFKTIVKKQRTTLSSRRHDTLASSYDVRDGKLVWWKPTPNGPIEQPLTNFTARINSQVAEDDGVDVRRSLEIEAALNGRTRSFQVPAAQFPNMNWAIEHLGAGAIVYPGTTVKDHARAAIQMLSGEPPERTIYAHLGWREIGGEWVYLHAGGAIGPAGAVPGVEVNAGPALQHFVLPAPVEGADVRAAIRASLALLEVAPKMVMVPLFAAIWRAPLGTADFGLHLVGRTGAGKSELASLVQQHYGAGLDARHLPGSWSSTANALEGLAFAAKDSLLVVDDFAPSGTTNDVQRYHAQAERLFRAQGNSAGRGRMRADSTLKATKYPRGLILSTGEDTPKGHSIRARLLVVELEPNDLDWARLTTCQQNAAGGLYAVGFGGFVGFLAQHYESLRQEFPALVQQLRAQAASSALHRRTPGIIADLGVGLHYFLNYAVAVEAITETEREAYWGEWWSALGESSKVQAQHQAAADPVGRFIDLLGAALSSGEAHVAHIDGTPPTNAGAWGWRSVSEFHQERGRRIGWIDGDDLYLEPDASFAVVQELARRKGEAIPLTGTTLAKRLDERGLLVSKEVARGTLKVRRSIEGRKHNVWHLSAQGLGLNPEEKPDNPDRPDKELWDADEVPF